MAQIAGIIYHLKWDLFKFFIIIIRSLFSTKTVEVYQIALSYLLFWTLIAKMPVKLVEIPRFLEKLYLPVNSMSMLSWKPD